MRTRQQDTGRPGRSDYRLEVRGRVGPVAAGWLNATAVDFRDGCTVLDIRVVDQSDLHGRLRRIHDLNLTLVSLRRMTESHDPRS